MNTLTVADGFSFIPCVSQYSGGVVAAPGHQLVRVQFSHPIELERGLRLAAELIQAAGRETSAMAAIEMRSPVQFTDAGFFELNARYTKLLTEFGMRGEYTDNPIARSNVCPTYRRVDTVSVHAFTFSIPSSQNEMQDYVLSGAAEVPEGLGSYDGHIRAHGDVSPAGLSEKAAFVVEEMNLRRATLGVTDRSLSALQVYTVHDALDALNEIVLPGLFVSTGPTLIPATPPVVGLEFEMDGRNVGTELLIDSDEPCLDALRALDAALLETAEVAAS